MPNQIFSVFVAGEGVGLIPISPPSPDDAYKALSEEERKTVDAYAAEIAFHLNAVGFSRPKW